MEKKEVKLTRNEVFGLYRVLSPVKVKGMDVNSRRIIVGYMLDLGKIVKAAEEFQKVTVEAHKPENYETLQASKKESDKKEFEDMQKELEASANEIINPYFNEEVTLMYEGISSDELDKLADLNDFTLGTTVFLNEKLILE